MDFPPGLLDYNVASICKDYPELWAAADLL
jgi:hypothetical protein